MLKYGYAPNHGGDGECLGEQNSSNSLDLATCVREVPGNLAHPDSCAVPLT